MNGLTTLSRSHRVELIVTSVMMQLADGTQWDRMQEIMDEAVESYSVGDDDELHIILATRMNPPAKRTR